MPPFVVTVPAAFARVATRLLALGRQHLSVEVVDAAAGLIQSWAQTLAVGNTSGGQSPTIDAGDMLVVAGTTSDWEIRNLGNLLQFRRGSVRFMLSETSFQMRVTSFEWQDVIASPQVTQGGTQGHPLLVKAQDGTGGIAGGLLNLEGGDTDNGAGGQVVVQGGTGTTAAGRARIRHDDDSDAIVVEGNGSAHTGGQAILVDQNGLAFFDGTPVDKPAVVGAKGGNAALTSLCTTLANMGLITDNTT